jgi:hypothetical protein
MMSCSSEKQCHLSAPLMFWGSKTFWVRKEVAVGHLSSWRAVILHFLVLG